MCCAEIPELRDIAGITKIADIFDISDTSDIAGLISWNRDLPLDKLGFGHRCAIFQHRT